MPSLCRKRVIPANVQNQRYVDEEIEIQMNSFTYDILVVIILFLLAAFFILFYLLIYERTNSDFKISEISMHDSININNDIIELKENFKRCNYAASSLGATILSILDTQPYIKKTTTIFEKLISNVICTFCDYAYTANAILEPDIQPGRCWAFKGSKGSAIISLYDKIHIETIIIEHIQLHESPVKNLSSAPRQFVLTGLLSKNDGSGFNFGTFQYIIHDNATQYFKVKHTSPLPFKVIKFEVLSNWGNEEYTCVYSLRIYGELHE